MPPSSWAGTREVPWQTPLTSQWQTTQDPKSKAARYYSVPGSQAEECAQ
ncbi:hypothetical protein ABZ628_29830 [Streptomyces diastaticus]